MTTKLRQCVVVSYNINTDVENFIWDLDVTILLIRDNFVDVVRLVRPWFFYEKYFLKFCSGISRSYVATIIEMRIENENEY